jgi:hypothetical protein
MCHHLREAMRDGGLAPLSGARRSSARDLIENSSTSIPVGASRSTIDLAVLFGVQI